MKKYLICLSVLLLAACTSVKHSDETVKSDLRAPAVPLLSLHPHVTLWSAADKLNERHLSFANGKVLPFIGYFISFYGK